jgi:predicted ester cyclase
VPEASNQNKQTIVRLYEEVVNQGRLEVLDDIAWPDHIEHRPLPGQTQGREGLKQRASMLRAAFNPHFNLDHVIADDDKVAVMWTSRGTHVAEWFGIAPTGKSIVTRGVDIFLLRDGRLAEHWDVVDVTDFLVQSGALPAPSVAPGAGR